MFVSRILMLAVVGTLSCACTTLRTVKVTISPEIANKPVRVDIRPATPALENLTAQEYWRPGSGVREAGGNETLDFGPMHPLVQEVTSRNWHARKVLVIADVSGLGGDPASRLELSVSGKSATKVADVRVGYAGIRVEPPAWPR